MKIILEVKEEVTRSLVIDTDDYIVNHSSEVEDHIFEIAEIINHLKHEYTYEMNERKDETSEEREFKSVEVKPFEG